MNNGKSLKKIMFNANARLMKVVHWKFELQAGTAQLK